MKVRFALCVVAALPLVFSGCGARNHLANFGNFRLTAFSSRHSEEPETFGNASMEPELGFVEALALAEESEGATVIAAIGEANEPFVATPAVLTPPALSPSALPPEPPLAPTLVSVEQVEQLREATPNNFVVKTTAFTHEEADSLKYGTKNAQGSDLKYSSTIRSAAADWSRFPVGTKFKIKGLPYEYVVDDYGRALVGTDTIDLYKPNMAAMNRWGAREVGIEVLEWGSFNESKKILETRKHKPDANHVREMLKNIDGKMHHIPKALRDGFEV